MTTVLLLRVSPRHHCATPLTPDYPVGTLWRCDQCQRVWVRQLINDWAHITWCTAAEWRRAKRAERKLCTL